MTYRYRIEPDQYSDPVREWADQECHLEGMTDQERDHWLDPARWVSHGVTQEHATTCNEHGETVWHQVDAVWGFDTNVMFDHEPVSPGVYRHDELPAYMRDHFTESDVA